MREEPRAGDGGRGAGDKRLEETTSGRRVPEEEDARGTRAVHSKAPRKATGNALSDVGKPPTTPPPRVLPAGCGQEARLRGPGAAHPRGAALSRPGAPTLPRAACKPGLESSYTAVRPRLGPAGRRAGQADPSSCRTLKGGARQAPVNLTRTQSPRGPSRPSSGSGQPTGSGPGYGGGHRADVGRTTLGGRRRGLGHLRPASTGGSTLTPRIAGGYRGPDSVPHRQVPAPQAHRRQAIRQP